MELTSIRSGNWIIRLLGSEQSNTFSVWIFNNQTERAAHLRPTESERLRYTYKLGVIPRKIEELAEALSAGYKAGIS